MDRNRSPSATRLITWLWLFTVLGFLIFPMLLIPLSATPMQPDTAACTGWATEILRYGRAWYATDRSGSPAGRMLTYSIPKPTVILASMLHRPFVPAAAGMRIVSSLAWSATILLLSRACYPRGLKPSVFLLFTPVLFAGDYLTWTVISQASILHLATAVGAVCCLRRSNGRSLPWSVAAGLLLLLCGLTRPSAWVFTVFVLAISMASSRASRRLATALLPGIGLLAPIIWMLVDLAFSGDALWSSRVVRLDWAGYFADRSTAASVLQSVVDYADWLRGTAGYPVLALALPGVVVLPRRYRQSRLVVALAGVEFVVFLGGAVAQITGFTPRFLALVTLVIYLAAGATSVQLCQLARRFGRGAYVATGLLLAMTLIANLGPKAAAEARTCTRMRRDELAVERAATWLAPQLAHGDRLVVPMRYVPLMAEKLGLYPMVENVVGIAPPASNALNAALSSGRPGWIVVPHGSDDSAWLRSAAESANSPGTSRVRLAREWEYYDVYRIVRG